jgi:hypothetical protein
VAFTFAKYAVKLLSKPLAKVPTKELAKAHKCCELTNELTNGLAKAHK